MPPVVYVLEGTLSVEVKDKVRWTLLVGPVGPGSY
jgi:hypothetical protein